MQSFLITGKNLSKSIEKSEKIIKKREIGEWDKTVLEFDKTLGIEEVRKFQEKVYLKPLKSAEKAVIFITYHGVTPEAQNAMLKILEEPPQNTVLIIIAENIKQFLPTVVSRCQVYETRENFDPNTPDDNGLNEILNGSSGEKLFFAQKLYEDKAKAVEWISQSINILRSKLHKGEGEAKKTAKNIRYLNESYYLLKNTNTNPRLILENLFLSLS